MICGWPILRQVDVIWIAMVATTRRGGMECLIEGSFIELTH